MESKYFAKLFLCFEINHKPVEFLTSGSIGEICFRMDQPPRYGVRMNLGKSSKVVFLVAIFFVSFHFHFESSSYIITKD